MNGILLVDKPSGWTSFDVVNKVRSIVRRSDSQDSQIGGSDRLIVGLSDRRKNNGGRLSDNKAGNYPITHAPKVRVGHTGTLDPLATGLLVLLLGDYTKRAPELTKLDKTYEVTMKLGETSTTGDREGEIVASSKKQVARDEVKEALQKFTGEIMQTPPVYSAVKINGRRAYKLAREGKTVEIEPRKVTVYGIRLTEYGYPFVKFTTEVSSGTYVRSLVEDVGSALGTGAYMSDLRRTKVGQFDLNDASRIDDESLLQHVFSL